MPMEPATSKKFSAYQDKQRQEGYQRFKKYDLTIADEGRTIIKNRWWWCINGKPEMALFNRLITNPMCNSDRRIAEGFSTHPDAELIFIETGYVNWDEKI